MEGEGEGEGAREVEGGKGMWKGGGEGEVALPFPRAVEREGERERPESAPLPRQVIPCLSPFPVNPCVLPLGDCQFPRGRSPLRLPDSDIPPPSTGH